jgi:hypothetical protein
MVEEESCSDGNVFGRISCILSYGGSVQDSILNYLTILLNLAYCVKIVLTSHHRHHDKEKYGQHRSYALGSLIFVVVFQVILCLLVGCSGVSIIWCAMGGWSMSERRRVVELTTDTNTEDGARDDSTLRLADRLIYFGKVVILFDTTVIIYYMVVSPAITTVAHLCALVLGAVLSEMSLRIVEPTPGSLCCETLEGSPSRRLLST